MKQFNLDLAFKIIKPEDRKNWPSNKNITEMMFRVLVQVRYPQGMNGTESDVWSDVMEKMAEATAEESRTSTIDLDKSAILWLLGVVNWCRDNSKVPPLMTSWVRTILDALEECKKQSEVKLESVKK